MAILGPFKVNRGYNAKASAFTLPENQALTFQELFVDYDIIKAFNSSFQLFDVSGGVGANNGSLAFWNDPNNNLSTNAANIIIQVATVSGGCKLYTAPFLAGADAQALTATDRTGALSFTTATGLFGTSQLFTFDSLNAIFIGTGQSFSGTVPFKLTAYNVNGVVLGGSPPSADAIKVVNNFVFLGRNLSSTSVLSRVYWSNVGDPETWGGSNFVDFRKNDGDMITALGSIGQDLIIFKNRSIGRLYTTPPSTAVSVTLGPLVTLSTSIGCCGPTAVDQLPDGTLVFMGSDLHLYNYDGVTFQDLTDLYDGMPNIQDFITPPGTSTSTTSNQLMIDTCVRYYPTKKQIWICFNNLTSFTIVFHLRSKAWSTHFTGATSTFAIVGPLRASASPVPYLIIGRASRAVYLDDRQDGTISYNVNGLPTFQWAMTFTGESADFIPRSICLPITGTNSSSAITVAFGFDGVLGSVNTTISGTAPILNRITIPFKEDQAQKKPINFMFQIVQTGNSPMNIHPFYLSDEVMS